MKISIALSLYSSARCHGTDWSKHLVTSFHPENIILGYFCRCAVPDWRFPLYLRSCTSGVHGTTASPVGGLLTRASPAPDTTMPAETPVMLETATLSSSLGLERNILAEVFAGLETTRVSRLHSPSRLSSEHMDVLTERYPRDKCYPHLPPDYPSVSSTIKKLFSLQGCGEQGPRRLGSPIPSL